MSISSTPIVGAHFRPPAKAILAAMPAGAELLLERDPENPYDPFAVKVLVDLTQFTGNADFWEEVDPAFGLAGKEKDEVLGQGPFQLGFVDSKKTGHAKIVSEELASGRDGRAKLGFDGNGQALALIEWSHAEREGNDVSAVSEKTLPEHRDVKEPKEEFGSSHIAEVPSDDSED